MLTNQHRLVARMINCNERTEYKKHMCGVCHALGDDYGMVSRLITNHEIILLNMLTEAQCQTLPDEVMRRCPLNPRLHVRTNQTVSSRFAAAIAVMLVNTSVEDDLRDNKGLQLPTRLLKTMTSRLAKTAQQTLNALSFDTRQLLTLQDEQSYAEANKGNPLAPSMQSSATIFAMTSNLAGQPHNQPALATIGANYGAYLYLLDAVKDYSEDYNSGQFNPLMDYAAIVGNVLTLKPEGVAWLKGQFSDILQAIQNELAHLELYHYQAGIQKMLTEPIQRVINRLNGASNGIHYAQITRSDIWKSLLLMSDENPKGESVDDFFSDEEGKDQAPKKKSRKKQEGSSCSDCCSSNDTNTNTGSWSCVYLDLWSCGNLDCNGCGDCGGGDGDSSSCGNMDCSGCGNGCDGADCSGCDCNS